MNCRDFTSYVYVGTACLRLAVHDNRQDDNGVRVLEIRRQVNGPNVLLKYFSYLLCFLKMYVMRKVCHS